MHVAIAAICCAFSIALVAPAAPPTPKPSPSALPSSSPARSSSRSATNEAPFIYVRGQALTAAGGFLIFTTGDALRLRATTAIPPKLTIGSLVRVTIDRSARDVTLIELDPPRSYPSDTDIADLPRDFIALSPKSVRPITKGLTVGALGAGTVSVTIKVHVPADTPPTDDVYLSTDRSNYSPAEIRMQRVDARRFTISLGLPAGTLLKYQFTRGTYQTVERDRTGGIVQPHQLPVAAHAKSDDTIARWADIS